MCGSSASCAYGSSGSVNAILHLPQGYGTAAGRPVPSPRRTRAIYAATSVPLPGKGKISGVRSERLQPLVQGAELGVQLGAVGKTGKAAPLQDGFAQVLHKELAGHRAVLHGRIHGGIGKLDGVCRAAADVVLVV